MLPQLFGAWALMAACVVVHAIAVVSALRMLRLESNHPQNFWQMTMRLVSLAGWMVMFHLLEIALWAAYYTATSALPDFTSSLYFSAVTYTTTGYGDVVLDRPWRLVGGIEALTGILMCGWTTGFFFAAMSRFYERMRGRT
jgi:hypothetical protein